MFDTSPKEFRRNLLFMICASICRIPVWLDLSEQNRHVRVLVGRRMSNGRRLTHTVTPVNSLLVSIGHIQLRPVTYKGTCDLTPYFCITYNQNLYNFVSRSSPSSSSPAVALEFFAQPRFKSPFASEPVPFLEIFGIRA